MALSKAFRRGKMQSRKGQPERFRAALIGRNANSVLCAGIAETQDAADDMLIERLRAPFRGTYEPLWLHFRGETVLIWRNGPEEWAYGFIREKPYPVGQCLSWASRDEAERAARSHLASIGWDGQEETSEIITSPEGQKQFAL
jgi:hypothetical protein